MAYPFLIVYCKITAHINHTGGGLSCRVSSGATGNATVLHVQRLAGRDPINSRDEKAARVGYWLRPLSTVRKNRLVAGFSLLDLRGTCYLSVCHYQVFKTLKTKCFQLYSKILLKLKTRMSLDQNISV